MRNSYLQAQMQLIQSFSNDSGVKFDKALKLPYHFIPTYYESDAWKIQKEHAKNDAQIQKNLFQHLANVQTNLRNLSKSLEAFAKSR